MVLKKIQIILAILLYSPYVLTCSHSKHADVIRHHAMYILQSAASKAKDLLDDSTDILLKDLSNNSNNSHDVIIVEIKAKKKYARNRSREDCWKNRDNRLQQKAEYYQRKCKTEQFKKQKKVLNKKYNDRKRQEEINQKNLKNTQITKVIDTTASSTNDHTSDQMSHQDNLLDDLLDVLLNEFN